MSQCNPGYCCCGTCNLSMATVSTTPGVCQKAGTSTACNLQTTLNAIGKWGVTAAGIASGRAVTTTAKGVSIAPSGATMAASVQSYMPIILLVVAAIVVIVLFRK